MKRSYDLAFVSKTGVHTHTLEDENEVNQDDMKMLNVMAMRVPRQFRPAPGLDQYVQCKFHVDNLPLQVGVNLVEVTKGEPDDDG